MPKLFTPVFILICLFAHVSGQAQSKWENNKPAGCIQSGIAIWPYNDTIYPGSYILMQCIGTHQQIIESLNANYHVYLRQGSDTMPLSIIDINNGQSNITSVLLKPARPLKAGTEYALQIDNDSLRQQFIPEEGFRVQDFAWHRSGEYTQPAYVHEKKWYVSAALPDTIAPVWQQKPAEINRQSGVEQGTSKTINFGMRRITFGHKLLNAGDYILKVRLTNTAEQTEAILYVTPTDSTFIIGRANPCIGNYKFEKHTTYKAAFNVLDKFGKEYKWKGREVSFTSPD